MLSIKKVASSGKTADYFAKDDYYASDDPNHQKYSNWYGQGAQELLLEGNVSSESFRNVLEGNLPNGQKLGLNKGDKNIHDAGRDLVFSAPKSVSIMALVYDDKRLIEAHSQAVKNTLDEIEKNYFKTRVKQGGKTSLEATGKLVAAIFQHELSRNLDPQLHSHAIVANATSGQNGKWRSAYFDEIYDNKNFIGLIYRSELAAQVKELGYEITHTGKDCFFELTTVPKTLLDLFSSRSKKIRELAKPNATQKELEKITLQTREDKKIREHEHNLGSEWREKASKSLEKENLKKFAPEIVFPAKNDHSVLSTSEIKEDKLELSNQAVDFAIKHLSERKTVFSKEELVSTALNDTLSETTYADIEKSIKQFIKEKHLLPKADTFTTSELLTKENAIIDLMIQGKNQHQPITKDLSQYSEILSVLNDGQRQSAELIISSKDMVTGIQGYAGVGKTTYMLTSVNKIATAESYELIGLSPTGVATRNLNLEAGIKSMTLQRFLLQYDGVAVDRGTLKGRKEMQKDFEKKIVIVDEASMISTTQMKNLLTISKELNFKLVLVGDRKQLDSVEAGVPFFELQRNGMALAEMREIFRQKTPQLKAAVYATINRKIPQAFKEINYDVINVNSISKDEINKMAVSQFMAMPIEVRHGTMILTPANENREEVNQKISELLYEERKTQIKDKNVNNIQKIYQNKNLTEAEKTRAYRFMAGDVVFFSKERKYIGVRKGAYHEVVKIDSKLNLITIKTGLLTTKTFNPINIKGKAEKIYFEVFQKSERIFHVQDKVAFTRSIPEFGIINSDGATITKISNSKISLKLDGGKEIQIKQSANEAKHIDHAYAVTAHKAQGLTCKNVIAVCESKREKLTTQKNFYVEISRAQERAIIITDDKIAVIAQLQRNTGIEISAREHQGILSLRAQEKLASEQPHEDNKIAAIAENKIKSKSYQPILQDAEIKEHFLQAIKSEIVLDAKDVITALDKSFAKPSTKIRFGQKKEYEVCWHGEAGYVKNYKTDEIVKWGINSIKFEDNKPQFRELTQEEMKIKQEARGQLEKQKIVEEKEVAEKAKKYFESLSKPSILNTSVNPYLIKKGINNRIIDGVKFTKDDKLVVPLHDNKGEIHSLQFINPDGSKTFLKGGKKQGNFFMINQDKIKDSATIYIAEGFATAATINIATNKPVAVSFDAGNIEHVLKNLKTAHPNKEFVIAADNDLWKEHNTGREKAEMAAQKYSAKVILPNFTLAHKDEMPTDFNDLHKLSGIHEVQRQITEHQIFHEQPSHDLQI